jgi:hypothetical protein
MLLVCHQDCCYHTVSTRCLDADKLTDEGNIEELGIIRLEKRGHNCELIIIVLPNGFFSFFIKMA